MNRLMKVLLEFKKVSFDISVMFQKYLKTRNNKKQTTEIYIECIFHFNFLFLVNTVLNTIF